MSVISPRRSTDRSATPVAAGAPYDNTGDPHILDFMTLVFRAKWALLVLTLIGGAFMFWLTYQMPQMYEAQTTILPPDKNSSSNLLDIFKGRAEALKMLKAVENPSVDLLQNIFESETVDRALAKDSQCLAYYTKYVAPRGEYSAPHEWIHDVLRVDPHLAKLFVIADVETGWQADARENEEAKLLAARIPALAIDATNRFIDQELRNSSQLARESAEEQYARRKGELDSVSLEVERFQSENRIASLPAQIAGLVQTAAIMRTGLIQDEMKRALAAHDQYASSPEMSELQRKIEAATAVLSENETMNAIGPGYHELPALQQQLASLELRVKTLEPIVSYLRMDIEQQRISENRDHTIVQVLDPAMPPKRKTAPKRLPFLLLGLTSGFALIAFYVVTTRLWQNLKLDAARRAQLSEAFVEQAV